MGVVERLLETLEVDGPLLDLRVGTHWTLAVVDTGNGPRAGLASTEMSRGLAHGTPAVRDAGRLLGRQGSDLATWALWGSPTERSIGFAVMNALIPVDMNSCRPLNAEELILERGRDKRVAIVGHFPFVPKVCDIARHCAVLELNPQPGDLPAAEAPAVIPRADVVAITGMTLVNGTFEEVVRLCRPDAFVLVLGATTPLAPLLFDYGVDAISGTVIHDLAAVTAAVSQGANFRQMGGKQLLTMLRA